MSLRALSHVWEHSEAGGTDLLVLLAIADSYNDEEGCCRASVAYLARKARIHRATVQRHRANLEALGELVVEDRRRDNGSTTSSCYRLVGVGSQPAAPPRASGGPPRRKAAAPRGRTAAAPRSQEDPKSEPVSASHRSAPANGNGKRPRDPLFDALACAGRRVDLEHLPASSARTIAVKLAELRQAQPDVTPEEIGRRARRYRAEHPDWALTPASLVKHWAELAPGGTRPAAQRCNDCGVQGPLSVCSLGADYGPCPGNVVRPSEEASR